MSESDFHIGALVGLLHSTPSHIALSMVKTITNAWTTSSRCHDADRQPCLFGCNADDSLAHYLQCAPLLMAISIAVGDALPIPTPDHFSLLTPPLDSRKHILRVFISFHSYHVSRSIYRTSGPECHRDAYLRLCDTAASAATKALNMRFFI